MEQPAARHVWAQRFLRLADDRGWVLENHPKVGLRCLTGGLHMPAVWTFRSVWDA
jgi:hypothetical protein